MVVIGVVVLLLVLIMLNLFFMVFLGKGMFYFVKIFKGYEDSCLWGFFVKNLVVRLFVVLIIVFVILIFFILKYFNIFNYNDLFEVDNKYELKMGINVIEEYFLFGFFLLSMLVI